MKVNLNFTNKQEAEKNCRLKTWLEREDGSITVTEVFTDFNSKGNETERPESEKGSYAEAATGESIEFDL